MDIICAKCGKHFSSIEAAREHSGHCKETSEGEATRWIPAPNSKITPEEWRSLMKLINPQGVPPSATPSNLKDSPASPEKRKKSRYGNEGLGNLHKEGKYSNDTVTTKNDTRVVLIIFIVIGVFAVIAPWYRYLASFSILWLVISILLSIIFIPASTLWILELTKQMKLHHHKKENLTSKAEPDVPLPLTDLGKSKNIPVKKETAKTKQERKSNYKIQNWLIAILLVFALCIVGLGISIFVGNFIPLWLTLGFSFIFSIEKWFHYYTRRHKVLGKLYRLFLNLSILSLLCLIVWSGIKLFSQQFVYSQLIGSLIFLAEFVFFVWLWRIVSKNRWRWPSMKLTVFSSVCLFLIFSFAGVQPMASYKDIAIEEITAFFNDQKEKRGIASEQRNIEQDVITEENDEISGDSLVNEPIDTVSDLWNTSVDDYADRFNDYRLSVGLAPLEFTDDLNRVAELRLKELYTDFSHHSAGNYNEHLAENIAMITGFLSNSDALVMWQNSPGHNANMLESSYRYTGYAIGNGYAVQVFTEYITINGEPQLPPGWYWAD